MRFIQSISILAQQYDAFILDLWGVIHDGKVAYDGVHECLENLKAAGKKIILLSNAPRRAESVSLVMDGMGIERRLYDAIITSGEAAYKALASGNGLPIRSKQFTYMGLEKDRRILDGLDYQEVANSADAGFALVSHSCHDNQPMEELQPLLDSYLAAGLTVICVNPDLEVVRQTGERVACAGLIAAKYESMGGKVVYFGKPHALVYAACFDLLGGVPKKKILAVGDSPRTDIAGAINAGIDSAIVTGGVLAHEVGNSQGSDYLAKTQRILSEANVSAKFVLERFVW